MYELVSISIKNALSQTHKNRKIVIEIEVCYYAKLRVKCKKGHKLNLNLTQGRDWTVNNLSVHCCLPGFLSKKGPKLTTIVPSRLKSDLSTV